MNDTVISELSPKKPMKKFYIGFVGDMDPIEHDGGFVYRIRNRVKNSVVLEWCEQMLSGVYRVYRCHIPYDLKKEYDWVDWEKIKEFCAEGDEQWVRGSPVQKASIIYNCLRPYYGSESFDPYFRELTKEELERNWKHFYNHNKEG